MEDLLSGEEAKKKSDKVTSSQSLPNLAFIDTNEVMNDLLKMYEPFGGGVAFTL